MFNTFSCDNAVGDGRDYLRADYSLSCDSNLYRFFRAYAILMIFVRASACRLGESVDVWPA